MDKNRIEGIAEDVAGKVEETAGNLIGDGGTQLKGKARQAMGAAQETYGKAADQIKPLIGQLEQATQDRPIAALIVALITGFVLARFRRFNQK